MGTTQGGVFGDEIIGFTKPAGKIGPGTYDVVYDECQDKILGPEDKLFPGAFKVEIPTGDIPALPDIANIKKDAKEEHDLWLKYAANYYQAIALLNFASIAGGNFFDFVVWIAETDVGTGSRFARRPTGWSDTASRKISTLCWHSVRSTGSEF